MKVMKKKIRVVKTKQNKTMPKAIGKYCDIPLLMSI